MRVEKWFCIHFSRSSFPKRFKECILGSFGDEKMNFEEISIKTITCINFDFLLSLTVSLALSLIYWFFDKMILWIVLILTFSYGFINKWTIWSFFYAQKVVFIFLVSNRYILNQMLFILIHCRVWRVRAGIIQSATALSNQNKEAIPMWYLWKDNFFKTKPRKAH